MSSRLKFWLAGGLFLMLLVGFFMLFSLIVGVGIFAVVSGADDNPEAPARRFWAAAPQAPAVVASTNNEETANNEETVNNEETTTETEAQSPVTAEPTVPQTGDDSVATVADDPVQSQPVAVAAEGAAPTVVASSTPAGQTTQSVQATPTPQPQSNTPTTAAAAGNATATASPTPSPTTTSNGTATATPRTTATSTPVSTTPSTPVSTTTAPTAATATPGLGRLSGRLLIDGAPANSGLTLFLEDSTANPIAEADVSAGGQYTFDGLALSDAGYTVVFAQEGNPQLDIDQVISWGWLGPIPIQNEAVINLPDFDIALQGFGQTSPAPNASFSAAELSAEPIVFKWDGYPQASDYWLDLAEEKTEQIIWQATVEGGTTLSFNGKIDGGGSIQPGEYWWGVGARRQLGTYPLIVYGYLPVLQIEP